jgi:hypothetical protein
MPRHRVEISFYVEAVDADEARRIKERVAGLVEEATQEVGGTEATTDIVKARKRRAKATEPTPQNPLSAG